MSDRTKMVIAMVLGALGLAIGIFATLVAVNARDTANSGEAVTEQVRTEFAAAQAAQDAQEQADLSKAERFVRTLSREEKGLVRKLRRTDRRLNSLSTELAAVEADQASEFDRTNRRISKTNQSVEGLQGQVANLKRQVSNLRQEVNLLEAGG